MKIQRNEEDNAIEPRLQETLLNGLLAQQLGLGGHELDIAIALADTKLNTGQAEKALALYAMVALCRPLDINTQCGLANCALQLQEYEMALQAASAVIVMVPSDCRGYYFSGAACLGLGHVNEAREDLIDALRFAENSPYSEIHAASRKLNDFLDHSHL